MFKTYAHAIVSLTIHSIENITDNKLNYAEMPLQIFHVPSLVTIYTQAHTGSEIFNLK